MAFGYTGKYCIVDLSSGTSEVIEPGDEFYRKYLTGYGLGAALIMRHQKAGIDPLSPDAFIGFCSGLLTGTKAFFSGRFMVVGKSPLTGGWGDANAGGFLSREIKRTGFDAIFFTGAAETPVWVSVTDKGIDIHDAAELWGNDINTTEEKIREIMADTSVQIASIGVSGEKRSLISGIATDKARIAARSGLGAVMGSKNLKAVAFRGKQKVQVRHPDKVKAINSRFLKTYRQSKLPDRLTVKFINSLSQLIAKTGISIPAQPSTVREAYRKYGTSSFTVFSALTGDMPIKNWKGVGIEDFPREKAEKGSDKSVTRYQKKRYACQNCPLGCGGLIDIEKGRYKGQTGHKPEYETIGAFGGLLLNEDFDSIIEINEMCNRAGIDTISTGATVAFAIECFENGIIDEATTGGLKLGWGQTEAIVKLTEMIIKRDGFGDVLADGVKKAAEKIGKGSEKYALHAGGQELPLHDSRLDPGFALAYQCEPTPGRHTISSFLYIGLFGVKKIFPRARRMVKQVRGGLAKKVKLYIASSFYMQLINGSGICYFGAITGPLPLVEYLNAVTGWDLSPDEFLTIGERILSLRKAFNVREGITPADQRINDRALGRTPLASGPLKGATVDIETLQKELFDTLGWDPATGGPTDETLNRLGIEVR
jgi:aldehyde:ferredoxin oxidoreductase